jgi:hypothetical protein
MRATLKLLFASSLLAFAGCTSVITNLTPSTLPRNPTGQYLVEMKLDTKQQTMREESVAPYVVTGFNEYKMRPTPKMANRWETYIPVPTNETLTYYRFKVDYEYNRFGQPGAGSFRSEDYKLTIKDRGTDQ